MGWRIDRFGVGNITRMSDGRISGEVDFALARGDEPTPDIASAVIRVRVTCNDAATLQDVEKSLAEAASEFLQNAVRMFGQAPR